MRLLTLSLLIPLLCVSVLGQTYNIYTYAGGPPPNNVPATSVSVGMTEGVVVDPSGNLYVASVGDCVIFRVDAKSGALTVFAGNGAWGNSGDNGPATSASIGYPGQLALDASGNLYIAERSGQHIRKVSNGIITTIAGGGNQNSPTYSGPATNASLGNPRGVAVDAAGNVYIADTANNIIREISNGTITTIAGTGTAGYTGDNGPAASATLNQPWEIALDSAGNLYVADYGNNVVRKISKGVITTFAGNGTAALSGDNGPATSASLNSPQGVVVSPSGNVYISDYGNQRIRMVSGGVITTFAGSANVPPGPPGDQTDALSGYSGDGGPATKALLDGPDGLALDSSGNLYIGDANNQVVRKVSNGTISTVAGNGTAISTSSTAATQMFLAAPGGIWEMGSGLALDKAGNLYIADQNDSTVRKVSNGVISTVAGSLGCASDGDNGPATSAGIGCYTHSIAVDANGNLYIGDMGGAIRKVSNGTITTFAGKDYSNGYTGDNGPATEAQLSSVAGMAFDAAGDLYLADTGNNVIRKISNGIITTVAGNGTAGDTGDNGPATSAELNNPWDVALDAAGNLYIADFNNSAIRKVSNGTITTFASNLTAPSSVALDAAGNVYIATMWGTTVDIVSNGTATPIAGMGWPGGYSGDNGPALNALLNEPESIVIDPAGNIYVGDGLNNDVRVLVPASANPPAGTCTFSLSGNSANVPTAGGNGSVNLTTSGSCSWTLANLAPWITISSGVTGKGSATIQYQVAANAGPPRSGGFTADTLPFTVQQGGTCTYALDSSSANVPVGGGSGSVNLTTLSGCQWSITGVPFWITITSGLSGTGNASIQYQVAANASFARASTIAIGGQNFALQETGVSGLTISGSMAHIASGGGWQTLLTLVNTGTSATTATLNFLGDSGSAVSVPLSFPQTGTTDNSSVVSQSIAAGASLIVQIQDPGTPTSVTGSAALTTTGNINGFAVFQYNPTGQTAVVPLMTNNAKSYRDCPELR